MQNDQYDPRLAGWVRTLSLARAFTDPSWKILILVGFVAAPTVHFLTDSMAWLVGIAAIGFLPLVACIATDVCVARRLAVLTSREEFQLLQHVVEREIASREHKKAAAPAAEPIVRLPSVNPLPRVQDRQDEPQETRGN